MSIFSIIFALLSSLIYYYIFSYFKDLSKTQEWAINIGVPCLIAATLILNHLKDKISERDPASKLHKVTTELKALKASHEKEIADLKDKINILDQNISLKDTMILGIKNGITVHMAVHGQGQEFFDYIKNFVVEISDDLEINTLTPKSTPQSRKWIAMASTKPSKKNPSSET